MRAHRLLVGPFLAALAFSSVSCSGSSTKAGPTGSTAQTHSASAAAEPHAVGVLTETFVDAARPTPAYGPSARRGDRTLVTTILYPATGSASSAAPQLAATPDRTGAPYPLIVFAHGLGASPASYMPLIRQWAAAGFVVAAPLFPLTNDKTPGGPDAGDVVNQPGDMSFVITSMLRAATAKTGTLAGLVAPDEIGAAGHSNGSITTLGLTANTCCHDARVKAAIIMAGTAENYPGGRYDFAHAPPMLIVHGTDDALIPYSEGVDLFNRARGPKGLLTVTHGDHGAAAGQSGPAAAAIVRTTIDFFDAHVRGDTTAADRLVADARSSTSALRYVPTAGSTVTIPTVPAPKAHLHAGVSPSTNLTGGQKVTVSWNGYTPGKVVNILQCSADDKGLANTAACDFSHAAVLHPDPTGSGSLQLEVIEGKVGTGTCDAAHPGCFIVVNNASSSDRAASLTFPITFAP